MKIEQCSTESPLGQGRNEERNSRLPRIQWKWMHNTPKLLANIESSTKREVYSIKCLCEGTGEISHKWLNSTPESSRMKRCKLTKKE